VNQVVNNTIRVFSGRTISPEDINMVKWARKTYSKLSRTEYVETVCELINWNLPSGRPKRDQCRAFLEQLEKEGIIDLPPISTHKYRSSKIKYPEIEFNTTEINGKVSEYEPIHLKVAQAGEEMKRWRAYVNKYHMLGDKRVFGCQMQYFVKSGETELGCLQFSASSWALEGRDKWIGWGAEDKKTRLNLIINNSRFLIFPWVHIKNLASKTLSIAAKQIQQDWLKEHCYAPVSLETFVDLDHFQGTCYKASNWVYLGNTKGRGRMDPKKECALSKKAIFMYPLQKDFRECLKGEKPYKVVNPDEQF
jgi:hypothetical protein